ncbi:hypothetical protein [Streptomyces genisteinicus]|uniref:Uncharacterized protein n=1 Tax=Streptomyces genisteinicus TaxID=2768068 RepID=A0A7H0HNN5_9ACTN|nr:hypothetical protein [Streptomyces genisteinicus]QNP62151.1 hypothetical protein IAG43_03870 [Streptomyces genisteinicus]
MTTARHLAEIDLLRGRDFPDVPGPSRSGAAGPGYHLARLPVAGGDGTGREAVPEEGEEQCRAECEALAAALAVRWGDPQHMSLWSASVSAAAGEDVPPPWEELGHRAGDVLLWRVAGRWIAVAAAPADGYRWELLVAVTTTDPP